MMKKEKDQRMSERFNIGAPIQFGIALNSSLFKSEISNCSRDGIYFESEAALPEGAVILLSAVGDYRFFRAEVKWSKKLDISGVERYAIGAQYIDPIG
jgi:hypothetical protein